MLTRDYPSQALATTALMTRAASTNSEAVENRPKETRSEAKANSLDTPIAVNTCEGESDADVQADPELIANCGSAVNSTGPSIPETLKLTIPGTQNS